MADAMAPSARTEAEEARLRQKVLEVENRGLESGKLSLVIVEAVRRNISDPAQRLQHYATVFGVE